MSLKALLKRSLIPLVATTGVFGAGLTGFALYNPATVVGDSFGRVLSHDSAIVQAIWRATPDNTLKANIIPALNTTQATSENLLAIGDEIMLTEPDRAENTFRILSVEFLNDTVTRIDTSLSPARRLLITARDMNDPEGRVIRFVLNIDSSPASVVEHSQNQTL